MQRVSWGCRINACTSSRRKTEADRVAGDWAFGKGNGFFAPSPVPEPVPAASQRQPISANASQFAISCKVCDFSDLRGQTKKPGKNEEGDGLSDRRRAENPVLIRDRAHIPRVVEAPSTTLEPTFLASSNPIDYIANIVYKVDTMARQPVAYLGEFEYLVLLAAIRLAPEAYALSILRELETHASRSVTRGALYSTLDRLEDKGLIHWSVATGSADRSNLPRRAYTVTAIGLASVRASHAAITRMARGLGHLLKDPA